MRRLSTEPAIFLQHFLKFSLLHDVKQSFEAKRNVLFIFFSFFYKIYFYDVNADGFVL
jgi:hypothetical protein